MTEEETTYQKVINAVCDYIELHNGGRPTVEEIGAIVGIVPSNVLYHLSRAVMNGDLVEDGEPRTSRRYTVPQ